MKYTNINETPLKAYPRPIKQGVGGYQYADFHADGWREIEEPELEENEKYGNIIYDSESDTASYEVLQLTEEEIALKLFSRAVKVRKGAIEAWSVKKIQSEAQELDDEEATANSAIYPFFEELIGQTIPIGFKLQALDEENNMVLWKALSEHEVKEQFKPRDTNYLYVKTWSDDVIPVFEKPQGYQDAYSEGDLVWFEDGGDMIFESKIKGNTWSPDEAPQHWEERPDLI